MRKLRQLLKQTLPPRWRSGLRDMEFLFSRPPLEEAVLHSYDVVPDHIERRRLSLVIPSASSASAYGGVTTGLNIVMALAAQTSAEVRILADDFGRQDRALVDSQATAAGLGTSRVEFLTRTAETPRLEVSSGDIFLAYNWWSALNLRDVLTKQSRLLNVKRRPCLQIIQDYEPGFYGYSAAHMLARSAFDGDWAIVNSQQLLDFLDIQGHDFDRTFLWEPRLDATLRANVVEQRQQLKSKKVVVYARPQVPRNCFEMAMKGLAEWASSDPRAQRWEIATAGAAHQHVNFKGAASTTIMGKLSLSSYANLLNDAAVGLSLMASPHPSYPPLEMAHFGLITITNDYANKRMAAIHENIIAIPDIMPTTIAGALRTACSLFEDDPLVGARGKSHMPEFLSTAPQASILTLAAALLSDVWAAPASPLYADNHQ